MGTPDAGIPQKVANRKGIRHSGYCRDLYGFIINFPDRWVAQVSWFNVG